MDESRDGLALRGIIKPRYLIPASEVARIKKLGNYEITTGNSNAHYTAA